MPTDNTRESTAGEAAEPRDPVVTAQDTAGATGDGAETRDPGSKTEGGTRRDPVQLARPAENREHDDDTTSTDVDVSDILDSLTNPTDDKSAEAKADEKTDPIDDDATGDDEQKDDEPANDEGPDAEKDAAKDDGEKPDDDADADEDVPTEEERKRLSKSVNKKIERLVKLKPMARIGEEILGRASKGFGDRKIFESWIDTGVRIQTAPEAEAINELVNLTLNVSTKGKAASMSPEDRAQHLRALADRIAPSPAPRVITLSDELREAVEAKVLSPEEAQRLALERIEANEGKPKKQAKAEETRQDERPRAEPTGPTPQDFARGVDAAKKVYAEYQTKYPQDWNRISKEVVKRVEARAPMTHPSAFPDLVRDQIDIVLGQKRVAAAPKAPPKSPTPSARTDPSRSTGESSDDELLDQIRGVKPFASRR